MLLNTGSPCTRVDFVVLVIIIIFFSYIMKSRLRDGTEVNNFNSPPLQLFRLIFIETKSLYILINFTFHEGLYWSINWSSTHIGRFI